MTTEPMPVFIVKTPKECSEVEINDFCDLVCSEGQVNRNTLFGSVKRAAKLCFAYFDGSVAGVAAIKNSDDGYRASVKRKSGAEDALDNISLEFGYVVVAPEHRRKGISKSMADALGIATHEKMFATSLSGNEGMHRTLHQFGFARTGAPYPSTQHPGQELILFIRSEKPT